jgi:hypothetical protein
MATAREKRETLDEWSSYFPLHYKWKNQFLIQRNGALLSGICLDITRSPKEYRPTFFFHNLLVPSQVVTLSYAAPLLSRGVYKPLKYGPLAVADVEEFKGQVDLCHTEITFEKFFNHIVDALHGRYGTQAVYLPHALRDIITVGSFLGDSSYYLSTFDECAAAIEAKKTGLNIHIIGSVNKWVKSINTLINQDYESAIQRELETHELPILHDLGMHYSRIQSFWERFT